VQANIADANFDNNSKERFIVIALAAVQRNANVRSRVASTRAKTSHDNLCILVSLMAAAVDRSLPAAVPDETKYLAKSFDIRR
jgi:hypothetical protein